MSREAFPAGLASDATAPNGGPTKWDRGGGRGRRAGRHACEDAAQQHRSRILFTGRIPVDFSGWRCSIQAASPALE
jgi:hypothetical protein